MSAYEEQLLTLITKISEAFRDVSRENGVSLSEAWVIDDYGSEEERAKARAQDKDTRWQDVPDEDIRYGYSCLSFFDDIGFRYYIPAYIIWVLKNREDWDSNTPESTIFHLSIDTPQQYEKLRDFNRQLERQDLRDYQEMSDCHTKRFSILTPDQSKAIAHFLSFLAEHRQDDYARKALNNYWKKFL